MSEFSRGNYEEARALLKTELTELSVVKKGLNSKPENPNKNKILFHLGVCEFNLKSYDEAVIYFSKIYTNSPDSKWAPESLLYIGKALLKLDKKSKAQEAFKALARKYPHAKRVIALSKLELSKF